MKHVKKYEGVQYTTHYKTDDYVLISGRFYQIKTNKPVKILRELYLNSFEIMYSDGSTGVTEKSEILRYLTPEEKNEYEIKLAQKKYNI